MAAEDNPEKQDDDLGSEGARAQPASPYRRIYQGTWRWLKGHLIPLAGLIVAVGIMVGVIILYQANPDIFEELEAWGYLGVFITSIIFNATIVLPVSNIAVIISMGAALPAPIFVGMAGGAGAAIGEMTGYLAGRSGRNLFRKSKVYSRVEGWVRKWGWIAVFVMSIFPFVFDIVGLISGALRMPLWRFLLAAGAGRIISYVIIAYLADLGFKVIPWLD